MPEIDGKLPISEDKAHFDCKTRETLAVIELIPPWLVGFRSAGKHYVKENCSQ